MALDALLVQMLLLRCSSRVCCAGLVLVVVRYYAIGYVQLVAILRRILQDRAQKNGDRVPRHLPRPGAVVSGRPPYVHHAPRWGEVRVTRLRLRGGGQ